MDEDSAVRAQQVHHSLGVLSYLHHLLSSESFVDVTLCCLGGSLRAHRVLLSACSPYLQRLLLEHPSAEHTTIILADVHREDMRALLQFMYTGGVAVSRDRIGSFLLTAEALQVKVLKDMASNPPWESEAKPQLSTGPAAGHALSMRSPCADGWRSADLAYAPGRSDSGCYSGSSNSSAMSDVKLMADDAPPPPAACYPVSPAGPGLFRTAPAPVAFSEFVPKTILEDKSRGRPAFKPVVKDLSTMPQSPESCRASPTRFRRAPLPAPPPPPPPEPPYDPVYHPHAHLPPHMPFPHPPGLPLPPPDIWARPLPTLAPLGPLVLAAPPPPGSYYQDGGGGGGSGVRQRPCLASIVTPSPWAQRRRPHCGAPRVPIPPHDASPEESAIDAREVFREPHPSPALPPVSSSVCRPGLIRPRDARSSPSSVVPKKRLTADAYRPHAQAHDRFWELQTEQSTAAPVPTVLNLSVPKTSPAFSEEPWGACAVPEAPVTQRAPSPPLRSPPETVALLKNDSNNNQDQFSREPLPASAPSPFGAIVRPIPTRPSPPEAPPVATNGVSGGAAVLSKELDVAEGIPTKDDDNNNKAGDDGKAHTCEACGKRFSRRQLLVQHRRVHTGERPYTCGACGKQFTQRGHWSTHQKLHEPARTAEHTCESCGKAFVTRASLKVHQRTHTGEKPFRCNECGKTFSQLRNFKYHRSVHEGTKEFAATCPECGKLFNDRGYLSSHMKIHRNRKEYGCEFCGKSFNQRVAYNMHVRIHTGEKPHQCPTCGKTFSRKMLLKQHLRIHTGEKPFSCSVCGKCFADRSNMTLHMRLHSGEKPYQCTVCCKSFTKKHHLKTHINYHTGLKPYACSKCGLHFSQSSNMRTHHKKCAGLPPGVTPPPPPAPSATPLPQTDVPSSPPTPPAGHNFVISPPVAAEATPSHQESA